MNKLSYGLLSLLSTEPLTGYDLMLKLNLFWPTTHSAIYPLLATLEENKYIKGEVIKQQGKPDKKLYSITTAGIDSLKEWIQKDTDSAAIRDEMLLKTYCIQVLDQDKVLKLLDEMENRNKLRLEKNLKSLEELKIKFNGKLDSINSPKFGVYLLIQKGINESKLGVKWCQWVRSLYQKKEVINFFNENFQYFL